MKLTLRHGENTTTLTFGDGGYIYANEAELQPPGWKNQYIDDGYHQGIVQPWKITLLDLSQTPHDGPVEATLHQYHCDVRHLFKVILILRERHAAALKAWVEAGHRDWKFKRADDVLDLDRFQCREVRPPLLTVTQMVRHEHVPWDKDRFAKALVQFRRELPDDQWSRLTETLSRYLPQATMSGCDGEIAFNGRIPGGCGFNGGIILRDKEFSVHT